MINIRSTAPKWPVRSVETLPIFKRTTLSNRVLVIGNTVSLLLNSPEFSSMAMADPHVPRQFDPITPLKNAKYVTELLGSDNAALVENQAVGHTTLAQYSTCTHNIVADYLLNSKVGSTLFDSVPLALTWKGMFL